MSAKKTAAVYRAVIASCATLVGASLARATTLVSASGPTPDAGTTVNFTTEGTFDWKYYGGITTTTAAGVGYAGNEMAGMSLFSNISATTLTGTVGKGTGTAALAASIVYSNGTNPVNLSSGGFNECYQKAGGETFTYSLPADSTETLRLYLESYDATATVTLNSSASGMLNQSAGLALSTASNGNGSAGSGNCSGLYTFTVSNLTSSPDVLTFIAQSTAVGGSSSVGVEGITAAAAENLLTVPVSNTYDLQASSIKVVGISDGGTSGGTVGSSATGQNLTVDIAPDIGTAPSFAGVITNNINGGSGNVVSLVFNGLGTQILSGVNTYSGTTTLNSGTLQLGASNALPSTTSLIFAPAAPGVAVTGLLNLNNYSQTVAGLNVGSGVTANISGGTLSIAPGGTIFINDSATGTETLIGSLNITGATIDASSATGAVNGYDVVINAQVSGTGGLTIKGIGASLDNGGSNSYFNLTNAGNNFTGGVNIASGFVNVAAGDGIFGNALVASTNTVTIAAGAGLEDTGSGGAAATTLNSTLVLGGAGDHYVRIYGSTTLTFASPVTDGGAGASLYKTDSGTLVLAGNNTYTGQTIANDGIVIVTGNESAATGGWVIGANSQYTTGVNFASGSVVAAASGVSINVGALPTVTTAYTAVQSLGVAGTVNNAGALNVGQQANVNLAAGAVWNQSGPMSLQPASTTSTSVGASLIVNTGAVFSYTGSSPINLTPSVNNVGFASLNISGGTLNTGQGFVNGASSYSSGNSNPSNGSSAILLTNGGTISLLNNVTALATTNGDTMKFELGGGAGGVINTNGFNTSIGAVISDATSGGVLTKTGTGTLTLAASDTYSGGTNVSAGAVIFDAPAALPIFSPLSIGAGASAVAAPSTGVKNTLFVNGLSIAASASSAGTATGLLDLTNNDLVVRGGTLGTVVSQVAQAYNHGGWNGTGGIGSSTAAGDTTHLTALGVIQNSVDQNGGAAVMTSFDGQPVNNTDILVKYTYYGDANLDGVVDGSDYSRIDAGYASQQPGFTGTVLTGWFNGDFNYDGVIDGSDYALIDNAFNNQGSPSSSSAAVAVATAQVADVVAGSAVPEPATMSLVAFGTLGLSLRRRVKR
jgi:autotransporter-associated beta strand protein